ncbi:MAG: copper homeostasis protein CutC [Bacteroidales bacterium]|nr:copper homeostasis protein CutC [Candidatus Scybalousia scybalohippi]
MKNISLEICTGSIDSCLEAQKGGANRVELCDNLFEGGTTPSYATILYAKEHLALDVMVMIRPRGGDFLYNDVEFELMKQDILCCKNIGVTGVVFGLLTPDGKVDIERTKTLVELAGNMKTCFHRAIDMAEDYFQAAKEIVDCGCSRILTSGQRNKAMEGAENIARLQEMYGDKIEIMAGSGVNTQNIEELFSKTHLQNYHFSAKRAIPGKMIFHQENVSMGSKDLSEYDIIQTDSQEVSKMRSILDRLQ